MNDRTSPKRDRTEIRLELFVVGMSPTSTLALSRLRHICEHELPRAGCSWQLEIIDVIENPAAAEAAHVVATPTLIRRAPLPEQRIVGDLARTDLVLDALGINKVNRNHTSSREGSHT